MNKRETIIIGLALVIGLYGLLDYFVFSSKNEKTQTDQIAMAIGEIDAFAESARLQLIVVKTKNKLQNTDYLISKAEAEWENDPFWVSGPTQTEQSENTSEEDMPALSYTGFIQAGGNMLAVINGMEYTTGEFIKEVEYELSLISPSHVVLLTQANKEIIIQLEEN